MIIFDYIQSYFSKITSINDLPKQGPVYSTRRILQFYRKHPLLGSLNWPDFPNANADTRGLCQFCKFHATRVTCCNCCAGLFLSDDDCTFGDDVTCCGCGAAFHYRCFPVQTTSTECKPLADVTKKERFNVECHACSSHNPTIQRKYSVMYLF